MPFDRFIVSGRGREQLIRLKRYTRIEHWNILCRWAFCVSMAEETPPPLTPIPSDSSVEIGWRVFAGEYEPVYAALLEHRYAEEGCEDRDVTLLQYFRMHLHRGLGYLAGDKSVRSIAALAERAQ